MAIMLSEGFADVLEKGMYHVLMDEYDSLEQMRTALFDIRTSDSNQERVSAVGALGRMQPFRGKIHQDTAYQKEDKTFTHEQFTNSIIIERALLDDDRYNVIGRRSAGLGESVWQTEEAYSADVFNNAFSGSGTIVVDGTTVLSNTEGQALCSSSHSSGSSRISTTYSNTNSTKLSPSAVETARQAMRNFRNDAGNPIKVTADLILVPPEKEETAWEIISSRGKVDSAENNANFHFGKYKLAVWDFLSSTTNYFVIDSRLMKKFLVWYDRIPTEFMRNKDFHTLVAEFAVYGRWSWGWEDWKWVHGSNPSV